MSNRRKPTPRSYLRVRYVCEGCQDEFTLLSPDRKNDPYPRQPETPAEENEIICTPCRRQQDEDFKELMQGYDQA